MDTPAKTAAQALEDRLRFALREYPSDRVERFLQTLKVILAADQASPRSAAGSPERLKNLQTILRLAKQLKKLSLDTLSGDIMRPLIENARDSIMAEGNLEPFKQALGDGYGGDIPPLLGEWSEMMPYLNTFIRVLEAEIEKRKPRRTGRKSVDPDFLLAEIAAAYADIFGELPISTQGGTFYNLAADILAVKVNITEPQRWVLAAVANLREVTKLTKQS